MARDALVVAGQDLDRDAARRQRLDRPPRRSPSAGRGRRRSRRRSARSRRRRRRWRGSGTIACEATPSTRIALLARAARSVARRSAASPASSGARSPPRPRSAIDSRSTSSGAPLTTSSALRAVVDEHGDAPALEIEGHLVDLLPSRSTSSVRDARGSPRRAGS